MALCLLDRSAPSWNLSLSIQWSLNCPQPLTVCNYLHCFPAEKIVDKKYALGPARLNSNPEAVILASLPYYLCHLLQET